MEFDAIFSNLKKQIYHPIYLLHGDEPYFIDEISDYIEKNVLTEAEKGFNQTIFYGKDSTPLNISQSSLRFPMMAAKQVIIVKEAQSLSKIEDLASYAEKPLSSTLLVLNYKYDTLDARTKLYKAILKNGVIFTAKKIYENKIPAWIENYLAKSNYTISQQAAQILTSFLGNDLGKIVNELNKLLIAVKDTNKITPEHIEKNIGISKEFNIFELQKALGEKNMLKANQIIRFFGANETLNPFQRTIASLYSYFTKVFMCHFVPDKTESGISAAIGVPPFFAKDYISASKRYNPTKLYEIIGILREYDMKSKGFGVSTMVDKADLQREMIYKILH
jgi:DNA polymerase-3 subunit delta